jgi:hypothetical protein
MTFYQTYNLLFFSELQLFFFRARTYKKVLGNTQHFTQDEDRSQDALF